jgi:hypothetical protein
MYLAAEFSQAGGVELANPRLGDAQANRNRGHGHRLEVVKLKHQTCAPGQMLELALQPQSLHQA